MYEAYLELGGIPLINAEATEAYLKHLMPQSALKRVYNTDRVQVANEEAPYRTPVLDKQPWVNNLDPATHGFLGLYPISIEGLDGTTMSAGVTEYLGAGGSVGIQRDTSRPIRVTGLLVGTDMLAAQAGLTWLGAALRNDSCTDCDQGMLRYFAALPDVCDSGAFGDENGVEVTPLGTTPAGTWRFRFPSDQVLLAMPSRVRWDAANYSEGTRITWGAAALDGIEVLQQAGPVGPLRRNWLTNPTFRAGLDNWGYSDSTYGVRSRVESGGVDDRAFMRVTAAVGQSFVSTAASSGNMPIGPIVVSFYARSAVSSTIGASIVSNSAVIGDFQSFPLTPTWTRYQFTATSTALASAQLVLSSGASGTFDIDQVTMEVGTRSHSYFDGNTVEADHTNAWEGGVDQSISRRTWTGKAEITRADSRFRPFIIIDGGTANSLQISWGRRTFQSMSDQRVPYERQLMEVSATSGVSVLRQVDTQGQGAYLQVEFNLAAGNPTPFSIPISVNTTPLKNLTYIDPEPDLGADDLSWLSDPNSIVITRPPSAPTILNPAIETITTWRRYYVPIPASAVADWTEAIPNVALTSKTDPITQVRVRFHPNPFGYAVEKVDPLSFCSEFIVSYLPSLTRLEVDGVLERATATRGDRQPTPADHLLYGADGAPILWPKLACAIPYVLTIDVPPASSIDAFDVAVALRKKA